MLARRLPQVISEAFARAGLDFTRVKFPGQAGDGYAAGIDYHQLAYLIHLLLDHLQDILAEQDRELRTSSRCLRMRLRASIHIGPVPDDDAPPEPTGIGKPMNDLHRLLDATPVRDALRHTDPDTTFVAAVISSAPTRTPSSPGTPAPAAASPYPCPGRAVQRACLAVRPRTIRPGSTAPSRTVMPGLLRPGHRPPEIRRNPPPPRLRGQDPYRKCWPGS